MSAEAKATSSAYRATITGFGAYTPKKILTNEDISKMVDTSDEWITVRTGIKQRHICGDGETTASLANVSDSSRIKID